MAVAAEAAAVAVAESNNLDVTIFRNTWPAPGVFYCQLFRKSAVLGSKSSMVLIVPVLVRRKFYVWAVTGIAQISPKNINAFVSAAVLMPSSLKTYLMHKSHQEGGFGITNRKRLALVRFCFLRFLLGLLYRVFGMGGANGAFLPLSIGMAQPFGYPAAIIFVALGKQFNHLILNFLPGRF